MSPSPPPPPAGAVPGLVQFLTEEVRTPHYADLLLERASAADRGLTVQAASGNAYYVSFGAETVVIEHLYLEDRPPLRVPRETFIKALKEHRQTLG